PGATFSVPLTFTIRDFTGNVIGPVLTTQTQTVNILFRPSANAICTTPTKWYNKSDKTCYNGLPQTFKVAMTAAAPLPDQVIWSVAFNTTTWGYSPIGPTACSATVAGCPYDSLNVGAFHFRNAPFVGTDLNDDQAFAWHDIPCCHLGNI